MHPPFFIPDTRVSSDIFHHVDTKPRIRRGERPVALRILPVGLWPPLHPALCDRIDDSAPALPTGRAAPNRPALHVVPLPRRGLREAFGRFLIRTGQRMILQNRPG